MVYVIILSSAHIYIIRNGSFLLMIFLLRYNTFTHFIIYFLIIFFFFREEKKREKKKKKKKKRRRKKKRKKRKKKKKRNMRLIIIINIFSELMLVLWPCDIINSRQ